MWPTVLEEGCFALTDTHSLTVEGGKQYPITNLALPEHIGSETFVQGNLKVRVRTWTLRLRTLTLRSP